MSTTLLPALYPDIFERLQHPLLTISALAGASGACCDIPICWPFQNTSQQPKKRWFVDQCDVFAFNTSGAETGANLTFQLVRIALGTALPTGITGTGAAPGTATAVSATVALGSAANSLWKSTKVVPYSGVGIALDLNAINDTDNTMLALRVTNANGTGGNTFTGYVQALSTLRTRPI